MVLALFASPFGDPLGRRAGRANSGSALESASGECARNPRENHYFHWPLPLWRHRWASQQQALKVLGPKWDTAWRRAEKGGAWMGGGIAWGEMEVRAEDR